MKIGHRGGSVDSRCLCQCCFEAFRYRNEFRPLDYLLCGVFCCWPALVLPSAVVFVDYVLGIPCYPRPCPRSPTRIFFVVFINLSKSCAVIKRFRWPGYIELRRCTKACMQEASAPGFKAVGCPRNTFSRDLIKALM